MAKPVSFVTLAKPGPVLRNLGEAGNWGEMKGQGPVVKGTVWADLRVCPIGEYPFNNLEHRIWNRELTFLNPIDFIVNLL